MQKHVSDISIVTPLTIKVDSACHKGTLLLKEETFNVVLMLNKHNEILGVVVEGNMSRITLQDYIKKDASASEARSIIHTIFAKVEMNNKLTELAKWFNYELFTLVITEQKFSDYKRK